MTKGCQHCGAYGLSQHTQGCQDGHYFYRALREAWQNQSDHNKARQQPGYTRKESKGDA